MELVLGSSVAAARQWAVARFGHSTFESLGNLCTGDNGASIADEDVIVGQLNWNALSWVVENYEIRRLTIITQPYITWLSTVTLDSEWLRARLADWRQDPKAFRFSQSLFWLWTELRTERLLRQMGDLTDPGPQAAFLYAQNILPCMNFLGANLVSTGVSARFASRDIEWHKLNPRLRQLLSAANSISERDSLVSSRASSKVRDADLSHLSRMVIESGRSGDTAHLRVIIELWLDKMLFFYGEYFPFATRKSVSLLVNDPRTSSWLVELANALYTIAMFELNVRGQYYAAKELFAAIASVMDRPAAQRLTVNRGSLRRDAEYHAQLADRYLTESGDAEFIDSLASFTGYMEY